MKLRMILIYNVPRFCYVLSSRDSLQLGRMRSVYVCICNGFTDGQVRAVCEKRQGRLSDVYKALGCAPKCGKCVPLVKELSRAEATAAPFAEAAA